MGLIHLDHYLALIFLMSLIRNNGGQLPGLNIFAPTEVTVQRGLCVHIPCTFTVPADVTLTSNAKGYWYRRDTSQERVAANDGSAGSATRERFFLTGDVWRGDCSLSINNALPEDNDIYLFRLEDTVRFNYLGIRPRVTVTELTEKPEISPMKRLVAGEEVTLTCTSPGRCTGYAPLITWEGVQGRSETFTVDYTDGNRTYVSNITFTPTEKDNEATLTCTVDFQRSMVTTSEQVTLNVGNPPSVNITIEELVQNEDTAFIVKAGDNKIMTCVVNSNPKAAITWYMEGQIKNVSIIGNTLTYELKNIGLSDAGRYWCSAQNEYGTANRSIEILVQSRSTSNKQIIAAIRGAVVLAVLLISGFLLIKYFRMKKLLPKSEDKKEFSINDCNVIYSDTQLYCNVDINGQPLATEIL
ncbi:sialic acid-binding Ig-like lectin 14 [Mixophyes fleayi]|uniref:sialic acid-binding Ig-like lectin 14 n=1 Tax=Mixophyes fleayi TaxID=3061075 RepID=UPI003F4DD0A3